MSSFDPNKLGGNGGNQKPKSERVFLAVEKYEMPQDGYHFAVGHRIENPDDKIRVRLTTVQERAADRPNENIQKIESQYRTGEFHRDQLSDKAKAEIKLLSFDDARKLGKNANGETEYRAHWPKTMSTDPSAETMWGYAHVRLRDAEEEGSPRKGAQAYVELLRGSVVATPDNIDEALSKSLAIKDEQGRARDPLVILRVMHEGAQRAAPRIYPATEASKKFDQATGEFKEIRVKVDAATTLARLQSASPAQTDFDTAQMDSVRALVAGIKGEDEPQFATTDDQARDKMRNLYYGAKTGALQVEIVAAEKIDFGGDSRKTYLADKGRAHLAAYTIKEEKNDAIKVTPGYTETMLAVHRHPDGEPYAVFASPVDMYPRVQKLADLPLHSAPKLELDSERTAEATQQAQPERVERSEPEPETHSNDDGPSM